MKGNKGLKDIKELIPHGLKDLLMSEGESPYRARQIISWIYKEKVDSFLEMSNLSKGLRERLSKDFYIRRSPIVDLKESKDGTRKILIEMADGEGVECVLIPDKGRLTLCISTQVGCGMGCAFCLTGRMGFKRNLKAYEMAEQVVAAMENLNVGERLTNIVLMGMGEPLANYEEVKQFIGLITSEDTWSFPLRRITLSTAGIPDMVDRMGMELKVNLAVSLNATTDEVRSHLMPINRRYPIAQLLDACRRFPLKKGRRITFEYCLIEDVNDSLEDAKRLVRLLRCIPSKVNLIPFNPFPESGFKRPSLERVLSFQDVLRRHHVSAFIRESKGLDIAAACGLLWSKRGFASEDRCAV